MSEFWQGIIITVGSNGLLLALVSFFLTRELQRHEKRLDKLNSITIARFSKFHCDAVDAIVNIYGLLVDAHNAVFRFCFSDWDDDKTPENERRTAASAAMVNFYTAYRKSEILMSAETSKQFDSSFHFLQLTLLRRQPFKDEPPAKIEVGTQVHADLTKTFPGLLRELRQQIAKEIGPEQWGPGYPSQGAGSPDP